MADPPLSAARPIVLVGPMGAGKSTVGPCLARRLGLPFVDADAEIEAEAGLSITEIFDRFGEPHFRDSERRMMARLAAGPAQVIAAGGGAFVDEGTRQLILERCLVVWLDAGVDTLAERVGDGRHRPLLEAGDPRTRLVTLAERRNPGYARAHIRVSSENASHEEVVDAIVAALAERRR